MKRQSLFSRRQFLRAGAALPLLGLLPQAYTETGFAQRIIFVYFPDMPLKAFKGK